MNQSENLEASLQASFADLRLESRKSRLGVGLIQVGWTHLAIFSVCEYLFGQGDRAAGHYLPLWGADVLIAFFILRPRINNLKAAGIHSVTRVAVRVWLTFAILCFTSVSLNSLTGFQIDWFKISWALLGTFAFAMMAWIFHLVLLIPAVVMSLTALLIAAYPNHAYLIFGVSWLVTLNTLGLILERSDPFAAPIVTPPVQAPQNEGSPT